MSFPSFFRRKRSVLIVEDDGMLRATMRERFEREGYAVYEAVGAQDALNLLAEKHPSVLILDLILPVKDGITLLEEVRSLGHDLPVMILSNLLGSEGLRGDAARLGAVYYNKSSTPIDTIVAEVGKLVDKR